MRLRIGRFKWHIPSDLCPREQARLIIAHAKYEVFVENLDVDSHNDAYEKLARIKNYLEGKN